MPAMSDRLEKLRLLLERDPNDPFVLYGIALEHKKLGDAKAAIEFLDKTIAADSGYCYAYYQKGQVLETIGESDAARETYQKGIAAAQLKGDAHAAGEIESALAMLG